MIIEVKPFQVDVFNKRSKLALPMDFIGRATVVGAYLRHFWHPYTYSAYHVIYKDSRKDTVYADHCKLVKQRKSLNFHKNTVKKGEKTL